VLGHCDLLSANVIILSEAQVKQEDCPIVSTNDLKGKVSFIDYEYAVPCPAAFDLANHLSEWGGYECDYNMLPTQTIRRLFIEEYVQSYSKFAPLKNTPGLAVEELLSDVDRYRGMPGLYWGVQALIQDAISDVEFDWTSYAEVRLAEFWAWRREAEGTRAREGKEMPLRERRWAQEE
jgi:ethanolamine kinase